MINPIHVSFIGKSRAEAIEGPLKSKGTKKERIKFDGFGDKQNHYAIAIGSSIKKTVPSLGFWDKKRYVVLKVIDAQGNEGFVKVNANSLKKRLELDETEWKSAINAKTPEKRMEAVSDLVAKRLQAIIYQKAQENDAEAQFVVGLECEKEGKLEDAYSHFLTAQKNNYSKANEKVKELRARLGAEKNEKKMEETHSTHAMKLEAVDSALTLGKQSEQQGNFIEAKKWYQKGIDQKNLESMRHLGNLILKEDNPDISRAGSLLFEAASKGNDQAFLDLMGFCLEYRGDFSGKDLVDMIEKRANEGSTTALLCLGNLYDYDYDLKIKVPLQKDSKKAKEYYLQAAKKGDREAIFELGDLAESVGNYKEAIRWYSIPQDSEALNNLGRVYHLQGIEKGEDYLLKAINCFEKVIDNIGASLELKGEAFYNLFLIYDDMMEQTTYDAEKATQYLKESVNRGNRMAKLAYAMRMLEEENEQELKDEAIGMLEQLATKDKDVEAMMILGDFFDQAALAQGAVLGLVESVTEEGVSSLGSKACKWFQAATDLGDTEAMERLAIIYESGLPGVQADENKAIGLYEKAIEGGNSLAPAKLGMLYENKGELTKAIAYYEQGAQLAESTSILYLGNCFASGRGVKKNWEKAFHYYQKAAELELADAKLNLGCCYAQGLGTEQDPKKAAKLFLEITQNEDLDLDGENTLDQAYYNLAICYATGFGVARDLSKAKESFKEIQVLSTPLYKRFINPSLWESISGIAIDRNKEWQNSTDILFEK